MTLVHVESDDVRIFQQPQQPQATNPKYGFLAESVPLVTSVQVVGECSPPRRILGHICVQKIDRNLVARHAFYPKAPSSDA